MIFNDVVEWYTEVEELIVPLDKFKEELTSIKKNYEQVCQYIITLTVGNKVDTNTCKGIRDEVISNINNIKKMIGQVNLMSIGKVINKLEEKIKYDNQLDEPLVDMINALEKCSENFLRYRNIDSTLEFSQELTWIADTVNYTIEKICYVQFITRFLIRTNSAIQLEHEQDNTLSIRLYEEHITVREIKEHMDLVSNMYERVCTIFEISVVDYPLMPVKIESGSLFNKLLGHEKAIKFLGDLFNRSIGFIYRNYTKEGKLDSSKTKIDVLKDQVEIIELCEKHGIDMSQAKEVVEQNVNVLFSDLYKLTTSSSKIEINGQVYDAGKEAANALIEEHKTKYLCDNFKEL